MRSGRRILFAALLLVPCVAMAADSVAPATAVPDFLTAAAVEPLQSVVPADDAPTLDVDVGLPTPLLAACTFTDYCASCSRVARVG